MSLDAYLSQHDVNFNHTSFFIFQLVTGVSGEEVQSNAFKDLYTSNLALILNLPASAVVITGIVEIAVRRGLSEENSEGTRVIVPGFRVTCSVTAKSTTVAALLSALRAASTPLNAILVDKGYTLVVLGTPKPRFLSPPTIQPTPLPPPTHSFKPSNPAYIILILVVTIAIAITVIAATFWYTKPVLRETLLTRCLASLTCCKSFSFRSFFTRR